MVAVWNKIRSPWFPESCFILEMQVTCGLEKEKGERQALGSDKKEIGRKKNIFSQIIFLRCLTQSPW